MPRPRLTLGRLMAWIAFAAVNLWILGAAYRMARPSKRPGTVIAGVVLLLLIYPFAAFAHRQVKAIRAALSAPTWEGRAAGCTPLGMLVASTPPLLVLIGYLLCVVFGLTTD